MEYNTELYHYGVKGMKWGQRKKRNEYNKDYTDKQRKRDEALYGPGSVKRINRKLNEGHSLQGARHYEIERRERKDRRKTNLKKAKTATVKALTAIGTAYVMDQVYNNGRGTKAVVKGIKAIGNHVVKPGKNVKTDAWKTIIEPDSGGITPIPAIGLEWLDTI